MISRRFLHGQFSQEMTDLFSESLQLATKLEEKIDKINSMKGGGRAQAIALTKLEETMMWVGKACRDAS